MGTCTGTNGCMTLTCGNTAMFFHSDPRALGSVEDHLTINIDGRTRKFGHCSLILLIQITWEKTAIFRADGWQRFKVAALDPNPQPRRHTPPAVVLLALDPWWLFLLGYPLLTWNTPFSPAKIYGQMIQWNHSSCKFAIKLLMLYFQSFWRVETHPLKHSNFFSPVCGYRRYLILVSYRNTRWKSSPYQFWCFLTKQCSKSLFYWMIYTHKEMLKKWFSSHQTMIKHHTEAEFGLVLCQMLGARWATFWWSF